MQIGARDREAETERTTCAASVCALLAVKADILFAAQTLSRPLKQWIL
jgi:hypothetical protein